MTFSPFFLAVVGCFGWNGTQQNRDPFFRADQRNGSISTNLRTSYEKKHTWNTNVSIAYHPVPCAVFVLCSVSLCVPFLLRRACVCIVVCARLSIHLYALSALLSRSFSRGVSFVAFAIGSYQNEQLECKQMTERERVRAALSHTLLLSFVRTLRTAQTCHTTVGSTQHNQNIRLFDTGNGVARMREYHNAHESNSMFFSAAWYLIHLSKLIMFLIMSLQFYLMCETFGRKTVLIGESSPIVCYDSK